MIWTSRSEPVSAATFIYRALKKKKQFREKCICASSGFLSNSFSVSSSVEQAPYQVQFYFVIILRLTSTGVAVGGHRVFYGSWFFGVLAFVDDVALLAPDWWGGGRSPLAVSVWQDLMWCLTQRNRNVCLLIHGEQRIALHIIPKYQFYDGRQWHWVLGSMVVFRSYY